MRLGFSAHHRRSPRARTSAAALSVRHCRAVGLSADEADYFRVRYSEALGREELAPTTRFLEEHRLARALSRQLFHPSSGGVEAAVTGDGGNTVLLYAAASESSVVGSAVDAEWISHHLLPAVARDGPLGGRASKASVGSGATGARRDAGPVSEVAEILRSDPGGPCRSGRRAVRGVRCGSLQGPRS
jgi:hypothetical protein